MARFLGGLVGATAALVTIVAVTWDDSDGMNGAAAYGGYTLGTAAGAALVTAIWETPSFGILAGAAIGALPLALATAVDNDGVAEAALVTAWITAPLGAAIGQR